MRGAPPRRGFTLLEVMVVIGIIAILAILAVPTLMDRAVIDQVNEALPLADVAKPPIEGAWRAGTVLPADNMAAGLPQPEKIVNQVVSKVTVVNGAINITFGNRALQALKGKVLTLRPAVVEDARIVPPAWLCGYANTPEGMRVQGENETSIPQGLLPGRCRKV